jgi:hypothetical protein
MVRTMQTRRGPEVPFRKLVDQLLGIIGGSDRAQAQQLLYDASGSVEAAVALHFSQQQATSARQRLRQIVGPAATDRTVHQLLKRHGNNVESAAGAFFDGEDPMDIDSDSEVVVLGARCSGGARSS